MFSLKAPLPDLGGVARSIICLMATLIASLGAPALAQWPQFGGPNRDFTSGSTGLASKWPAQGPKRMWSRKLGDGYSGIAVDRNTLFTMYRKGNREFVVALDADTGETRWKHRYSAKPFEGLSEGQGIGPRCTPLVVDGRVHTVGICAKMFCLDQNTGDVVWSHDLMRKYGARPPRWGYSSSPLAYKKTVIIPAGGEGHGVMAFNREDGTVKWARHGFPNAYSSPILIDVDGQEQLVIFMEPGVIGLNPDSGDLLWQHPHRTEYNVNASMPIWTEDNLLFISSAYNTGSRLLKLTREGDRTTVEELWRQSKMQIHFGSGIRIGDYVYGSTGGNGPVFFGAVNLRTGKMAFRQRGVAGKAQLVYADGKLVMLDEDGRLYIATVTPEGITIHAQTELLESVSWTAPTLVGDRLFVRDRKNIMALDLSAAANGEEI